MPGREAVAKARRLVVKCGSAVLAPEGRFDRPHFTRLCLDLAALHEEGREIVIVSSGAIALGVERLAWPRRPVEIVEKQAAASVGQTLLMDAWREGLGAFGVTVGQVLLTHDDFQDRRRHLNARRALSMLLSERVVPVINENDIVAVEEIRMGDNDALAGLVVSVVDADALILLSDIDGLHERDPRADPFAPRVSMVERVTPEVEAKAGGAVSGVGSGGMITKLRAAKRAAELGVPTVIASGRRRSVVAEVARGDDVGTFVAAQDDPIRGKRRWIAHALKAAGTLTLDAGAVTAVVEKKKSLLASGIEGASGEFATGDAVDLAAPDGRVVARGLVRYGAAEVRKIAGLKSQEIETALGYKDSDEVVHRDDLVVIV